MLKIPRMRIRTTLGELLPVFGTIGLLGLWMFQQTGIEERSSELRNLAAARTVYQTYQSNNALFNALVAPFQKDKEVENQIRLFQIYNYELGLGAIEQALPPTEKRDIPPARSAYVGSSIQTKINLVQERLEKLQGRLTEREKAVRLEAGTAKKIYLWLYLGLSLMMIAGAVLKAIDKVFSASG